MNETGLFALALIFGAALLIYEFFKWCVRRQEKRQLRNVVNVEQSEYEQERRSRSIL